MPLSFKTIYRLSDVNQNYIRHSQIAMAPRKVKISGPDGAREEYQFLVPNDVNLGHTIAGNVEKDEEDAIEIEDTERRGEDGKPVLWRFEPLTLKLWNEMGEAGEIEGWEELGSAIKDDAELKHFYRYEWLLPRLEWWSETLDTKEVAPASEGSAESGDVGSAE
jgi:hypothetical protein